MIIEEKNCREKNLGKGIDATLQTVIPQEKTTCRKISHSNSALIGIREAANILGMGQRKALQFLTKHGIFAINTSNGKRPTWQWSRKVILDLIDALQSETAIPMQKFVQVRKSSPRIKGKTPREIFDGYMQ